MLQHFVVTRLGLCLYDEARLAGMIDLFEAVTLPSLDHQSSKAFTWLIVIDAEMPLTARRRIESALRPFPNHQLVSIDVTRLVRVRQGCFDWVWDRCQDVVLENGLLTDPSEYITTSVIDADDAWHGDVIATVNRFMSERLPQVRVGEKDRGTWLQHTAGIAATFPHGYRWFIEANAIEPFHHPFMSMGVFVTARFSSGISACSSRHRAWPSYCDVLAFEVAELERDRPMWIYARHHLTTRPWDTGGAAPIDASMSDVLTSSFGIDRSRVQRWRDQSPANQTAYSASDQYDRVFTITALNRQIEALKRRGNESVPDLIDHAKSRRASLIDVLHASGKGEKA